MTHSKLIETLYHLFSIHYVNKTMAWVLFILQNMILLITYHNLRKSANVVYILSASKCGKWQFPKYSYRKCTCTFRRSPKRTKCFGFSWNFANILEWEYITCGNKIKCFAVIVVFKHPPPKKGPLKNVKLGSVYRYCYSVSGLFIAFFEMQKIKYYQFCETVIMIR